MRLGFPKGSLISVAILVQSSRIGWQAVPSGLDEARTRHPCQLQQPANGAIGTADAQQPNSQAIRIAEVLESKAAAVPAMHFARQADESRMPRVMEIARPSPDRRNGTVRRIKMRRAAPPGRPHSLQA